MLHLLLDGGASLHVAVNGGQQQAVHMAVGCRVLAVAGGLMIVPRRLSSRCLTEGLMFTQQAVTAFRRTTTQSSRLHRNPAAAA